MENIDLNSLSIGKELNPLSYSNDEYPTVDDLLCFILENNSRPPVNIDLNKMGVNGEVVKDSMKEYNSKKKIRSSHLKEALKSPLSFMYAYDEIFPEKRKDCFDLGTFAHMAFLEPDLFERIAVAPNVNLTTKKGVSDMINFYKNLAGKRMNRFSLDKWKMDDLKMRLNNHKKRCCFEIIDPEHYTIIRALKSNYYWYGGGIIPMILKGAVSETSFYGTDPDTGLEIKVRPDYFNIEENIGVNAVISYKTTRADSIGKFSYDCAKHMYELSEGMYQEVMSEVTGRKFNVTIMIMLQTVPPYQPAVLFWSPEDIQNGKYKYRQSLSIVKECFDKKSFQIGFDSKAPEGQYGIIDFELPDWSKKEIYPTAIDY